MSLISYVVNSTFSRDDNKRDSGLKDPDNILRFDNIQYSKDPKWNLLDVYRPDNAGKLPVIVSVHGGGWVYGDKERYQYYCMDLAARGFVVINFTYRLAPKFNFPKQLEDVSSVFDWLKDNSDKYDYDLNKVYALGDSAGAHLLALYCELCTNKDYALNFDFSAGLLPKKIALNCGVYNVHVKKGIISMLIKDLIAHKKDLELIDPLKYLNKDFPETYLISAVEDLLKDDTAMMLERFNELGIRHIYKIYDNDLHDLGHVFHLDIRSKDARICNDEQCAFFLND